MNYSECPYNNIPDVVSYYIEGILIPIVGILGVLGNAAAVYVLRQPEMRSSFNQLLITLSILDSSYLVMTSWDYSAVKVFGYEPKIYIYMFPYFWFPMKNILMSATTFLIMGIATERYLAVCRPWVYRNLEQTQSMMFRVVSYSLPSILCSIVLNIPNFLVAKLEFRTFKDRNNNWVEDVTYNFTSLRVNKDYILYYQHWTRLVFTALVPFLYLSFMNMMIYCKMRSPRLGAQRRSTAAKKASNLASILLVIVVAFLIANIPRLFLNVAEFYFHYENEDFCHPIWYEIMISINHLLLNVNSSINFLIYCSVGEKFKNIFCRDIRRIRKTLNDCLLFQFLKKKSDTGSLPSYGKEKSVLTDFELVEMGEPLKDQPESEDCSDQQHEKVKKIGIDSADSSEFTQQVLGHRLRGGSLVETAVGLACPAEWKHRPRSAVDCTSFIKSEFAHEVTVEPMERMRSWVDCTHTAADYSEDDSPCTGSHGQIGCLKNTDRIEKNAECSKHHINPLGDLDDLRHLTKISEKYTDQASASRDQKGITVIEVKNRKHDYLCDSKEDIESFEKLSDDNTPTFQNDKKSESINHNSKKDEEGTGDIHNKYVLC